MNRRHRTRAAFSWVEALVVLCIVSILGGLLVPAINAARQSFKQQRQAHEAQSDPALNPVRASTKYGHSYLMTIEHDGHLFVCTYDYDNSLIHHPGCPCLQK